MTYNFDNLREQAEKLSEAIALLPELEAWDLTATLYEKTYMNLADLQSLTSALTEILKPEA